MADPIIGLENPWESATFDGCRRSQLREQAQVPLAQRLQWACDMSEWILALHASALRARKMEDGE